VTKDGVSLEFAKHTVAGSDKPAFNEWDVVKQ